MPERMRWVPHPVVQGVHMLLDMGSSDDMGLNLPPWAPGEKRLNKLCFIGRNLNREELLAGTEGHMGFCTPS
jgi:hypothetical protein